MFIAPCCLREFERGTISTLLRTFAVISQMNANKESHSRFSRPFAAKGSYQRLSAQICGPMIVILRKVSPRLQSRCIPVRLEQAFTSCY